MEGSVTQGPANLGRFSPFSELVHVTWWDNFGKILKFQHGDMKQSNFSNYQWTAKGLQRQSLMSQTHIVEDAGRASQLLSPVHFVVEEDTEPMLPPDLFDEDLVAAFQANWLAVQDRVESMWEKKSFASRDVNRVPLKLPVPDQKLEHAGSRPVACGHCLRVKGTDHCECPRFGVFGHNPGTAGGLSIHASDEVSASPDGLLNFFPTDLLPHAIGSRVGLAKLLAQFNLEFGTGDRVKILNSDIDIYARIIKVSVIGCV